RHREISRRFARGDRASGVALELVTPAEFQIAGNRQEPARNKLGAGDRIPDILDPRVVGARRKCHARHLPVDLAALNLSRHGTGVTGNIDRSHRSLRSCASISVVTYIRQDLRHRSEKKRPGSAPGRSSSWLKNLQTAL